MTTVYRDFSSQSELDLQADRQGKLLTAIRG